MSSHLKSRKVALHVMAALAMGASMPPVARAQFVQQGSKLVGPLMIPTQIGGLDIPTQGASVALSADGNTALVGAPGDGVTWVYTRSGGGWNLPGTKLLGTDATTLGGVGAAVALSADGNTAIVGGFEDNRGVQDNRGAGAAWVYTRAGGVWSQQGAKLTGSGAIGFAAQGVSVALSADGNTALLGGPNDNNADRANFDNGRDSLGSGAAWVFTRTGGVWTQQGGKLIGRGGSASGYQGYSVALSADGDTAMVGGYGDSTTGAAWVYTRMAGVWSQQGDKLVGTGVGCCSQQGLSGALSADGNTALVGGAGSVWVYTRTGGLWSQQGGKLVGTGDAGGAEQGVSAALSADGNTAIVGGYLDNSSAGAAWMYTRIAGVWSQLGSKLVGADAIGGAQQGRAVALSADGSTAMLGGPFDNGAIGAAWVFVKPLGPPAIPSVSSVVNGASFLAGIGPGSWITIRGSTLSGTTRVWSSSDFSGNSLPTQLDGVSVTINGRSAYVYFISPTQLNVLAPDDTTQGPVPVQVTTPQGKSSVVNTTEAALSPALFTYSQARLPSGMFAAAVRSDGAYIATPGLIANLQTVPAKAGDTILLFGTGFGPTTPTNVIGELVTVAALTSPVKVTIGGAPAATQFAGIVSPGLYQFNVTVPNAPNGDNLVTVEAGGSSSQANVYLTVQQ